MIYAYFPYLASIHINQDPSKLLQPNVSEVSRWMREESLTVFYGRNNFFLDLRGWKHASYPPRWTPFDVFEHWITAIGDANAARIRSLTFFSHNFRVNVRVSNEVPPTIAVRLRTNEGKAETADNVPSWYTFDLAAARAEQGLQAIVNNIPTRLRDKGLTSSDFLTISRGVDNIQPFLCRRMTLGYQGTVLLVKELPVDEWPDTKAHKDKCDDCGYHRYTRGHAETSQQPSTTSRREVSTTV